MSATEELNNLRQKIDEADHALLEALAARFRWVKQVGEVKRTHQLPVFQPERWANLMAERVTHGQQLGLSDTFVQALFELIHQESVQMQQRNPQ